RPPEIRNTLNAMNTHIALLRKQTSQLTDSPVPRRIDQLERTVGSLDELLHEFLAVARPAQDQPQEAAPEQLAREVLEFVGFDLESSRVRVETDFAPDVPRVLVDPAKLKRALLNLVINARQAMPEGGVLTLRVAPDAGGVVIEVTDTGCGIPEEQQERIFQTFF